METNTENSRVKKWRDKWMWKTVNIFHPCRFFHIYRQLFAAETFRPVIPWWPQEGGVSLEEPIDQSHGVTEWAWRGRSGAAHGLFQEQVFKVTSVWNTRVASRLRLQQFEEEMLEVWRSVWTSGGGLWRHWRKTDANKCKIIEFWEVFSNSTFLL